NRAVRRLFQRDDVPARLVGAKPVPCLSFGNIVLGHVKQFAPLPDLPLRAIQNYTDLILAVDELYIIEGIALRSIGLGKSEELAVAIDFSFPSRWQIAFDPGSIEVRSRRKRTIGNDGAATSGDCAGKPAAETFDISESDVGGLQGAEKLSIGTGPERPGSQQARLTRRIRRQLRIVGEACDLARCIDGALPVDPNAVRRTIGSSGADNEIERRRPPHS